MTRFLEINFFKLDKSIKKKPTTKQNPDKRKAKKKKHKTIYCSFFTFVVLLFIDVGVAVIIILLFCSKKWLFSYVPL
jgi:hypothetical protein